MPDTIATSTFTDAQRQVLLRIAHQSIEQGLRTGLPLAVTPAEYEPALVQCRGAFVTLYVRDELHGCIGTIEASRPLVTEVARCAFAAAFEDPRFDVLTAEDVAWVDIHISVLSSPAPMAVLDEADLLRQLRPGIDGLVLDDPVSGRRGTFLPAVWEKLPDPRDFLTQLKLKAGFPADDWSSTLRFARYTAESIG